MNLKEIEARHEHEEARDEWPRDLNHARSLLGMAHSDRASLLAEVKRLRAFVAKVRAHKVHRLFAGDGCEYCAALAELDAIK